LNVGGTLVGVGTVVGVGVGTRVGVEVGKVICGAEVGRIMDGAVETGVGEGWVGTCRVVGTVVGVENYRRGGEGSNGGDETIPTKATVASRHTT
jgi:hypothetical protein